MSTVIAECGSEADESVVAGPYVRIPSFLQLQWPSSSPRSRLNVHTTPHNRCRDKAAHMELEKSLGKGQ